MPDNKKYYYIKLKDNYFEKDNIKIMEAQENGYLYSLIILKLYLKSAKSEGRLMMTETIPYSPEKVDILAKVLNHDIAHVKEALRLAVDLDLITILDSKDIWMTDIQNFIGRSSTEADRIREYRHQLKHDNSSLPNPYKCTPEKEEEIDKESKTEEEQKASSPSVNKETGNEEIDLLIEDILEVTKDSIEFRVSKTDRSNLTVLLSKETRKTILETFKLWINKNNARGDLKYFFSNYKAFKEKIPRNETPYCPPMKYTFVTD